MLACKPMPRYGRRRFAVVAALVSLAMGACLSPTLPLPPPRQPDVERVGQGQYRLSGEVPEAGRAEAMNDCTGLIYGIRTLEEDMSYSFVVQAAPGDRMQFWYQSGGKTSDSVFFVIEPELAGGDTCLRDAGSSDSGSNGPDAASDGGVSDGAVSDAGAADADGGG